MNGFEILFKSLGIDPEKIKAEMFHIIATLRQNLEALDARLKTIDARLERIELTLDIQRKQAENEEPPRRIANQ